METRKNVPKRSRKRAEDEVAKKVQIEMDE
jgi:hypothetical protein